MTMKLIISLGAMVIVALLLVGCLGSRQPVEVAAVSQQQAETDVASAQSGTEQDESHEESTPVPDYDIVTLLPPDAIPAIFDPEFLTADQASSEQYEPDEMVLGVEIDGDARAYSIPYLSGHEIVNDTVGGIPVAVTW